VQQVAQFSENPGKARWDAVKYIFRYLKGTTEYGLLYEANSVRLQAYYGQGATNCPAAVFADSNWSNDPEKRKSVGGYLFMMNGGVVDYNCKKHTNTPLSSTEAEWYAACEAAKSALELRNLLIEMDCPLDGPITIFEDNQGCVSYEKISLNHSSMRQIALKFHFLREEIAERRLSLQRVPSSNNIADIFTKALAGSTFRKFRDALNIRPDLQLL
jgi:hypothetical protein